MCYDDKWDCPNYNVRHMKKGKQPSFCLPDQAQQRLRWGKGHNQGRKPPPTIHEVFFEVRREEGRWCVMLNSLTLEESPEITARNRILGDGHQPSPNLIIPWPKPTVTVSYRDS